MTLSETQIDKFCQSLFVSIFLQTTRQKPQLPFWERSHLLFLRQPPLALFRCPGKPTGCKAVPFLSHLITSLPGEERLRFLLRFGEIRRQALVNRGRII